MEEKDQSEIEALSGLGNDSKMLTTCKRKREEEEEELSEETVPEPAIVLPFAKTSTLWKFYEHLDPPQHPHFGRLVEMPAIIREDLALVLMEAFRTMSMELADDDDVPLTRLQLNDNQETLVELEKNGFDVKDASARVAELLSLNHEHPIQRGFGRRPTREPTIPW